MATVTLRLGLSWGLRRAPAKGPFLNLPKGPAGGQARGGSDSGAFGWVLRHPEPPNTPPPAPRPQQGAEGRAGTQHCGPEKLCLPSRWT